METYIDIHSHILPGVDDGADSLKTSLEMLHMAAKDGITQIILTPHNKPWHRKIDIGRINSKIGELQDSLCKEHLNIKLYAGSELYYRSGLAQETEDGMAATLANSQYVLVEFEPSAEYDYIRGGVYELLMGGYYPIVAHVERYQNVCSKAERVAELINMGCFMQVNAGSITGKYGFGAKQLTKKMLKQNLVHFVATDAHDLKKRQPCLSQCAEYIGRKYGENIRKRLFYEHPMCVLHNEYIGG